MINVMMKSPIQKKSASSKSSIFDQKVALQVAQ